MLTLIDEKCGPVPGETFKSPFPAPGLPCAPMIAPTILHSSENLQRRPNPVLLGGHAFKRVQRKSESKTYPPLLPPPLIPDGSLCEVSGYPGVNHANHLNIYSLNPSVNQSQYCNQSSNLISFPTHPDWLNLKNPMILSNQLHYSYGHAKHPPVVDKYSLDRLPFVSGYDVNSNCQDFPQIQTAPPQNESKLKAEWHEPVRPYPTWKSVRPGKHLPLSSPPSEKPTKAFQSTGRLPGKRTPSQPKIEDQNVMDLISAMKASFVQDRRKSPECKYTVKKLSDAELKCVLKPNDYEEIMSLLEQSSNALSSSLCHLEALDSIEGLGRLYSLFVECKTHFFAKIPLFKNLAPSDKPRLLRLAVAISTHVSAAQHINSKTFTWPHNSQSDSCSPILSASTLRQILSHDHFVMVMKFYTNYCHVYADPKVTLLTEVLSLFYDEPGMADPRSASSARSHYLALLSRYLTSVYGWQTGSDVLKVILRSQREARQLTEIHQHVEFCIQPSRKTLTDVTNSLAENFVKMRLSVQDTISKHISQQRQQTQSLSNEINIPSSSGSSSEDSGDQAVVFTNMLLRLAACNDPEVLATAKQILPSSLLQRLVHLVE